MRRGFLFLGADPAADAMDARRLQRDRLRDRIPGPDCIPSGAQQERSGRRGLPCGGGPVAGWQAIRHPLFATRYSPSATRYPLLATRYSLLATELSPTSSFLPDRCLVGPSDPTMYRYPWPFVFVSPCGAFRPEVVPVVQDKKSPSATDGDSQAFKPLLTEPERLPELPSCPWPFRAWHRPECRGPVSRSA